MAKTLQEILGGRQMTGVIQTIRSGLPNVLPPAFLNVTKRVIGNRGSYIKVQGERSNAKAVEYGAPAQRVIRRPMAETGMTLIHSFEEQPHNPMVLQALLGLQGDTPQELAIEEVDRQTKEFKRRFENLRLSALMSTLRNGAIWFDGNGNQLFSSTGAVITIDFSVPANNQNQCNSAISASWATTSTDIRANINTLKKRAIQTTGRELKYAFYGANIPGYVSKNDSIKDIISHNNVLGLKMYETGELPDGLCGLTWIPAYKAFGLTGAGVVTDWWGDDTIVFCPEVSPEWWQFVEGSYLIPRSIGQVYADAMAAARDLDTQYGQFAYATVSHNPVSIVQYGGDTMMPILASPDDLYIADVTP